MSFYLLVSTNLGSGNRTTGGEYGDKLHSKGNNSKLLNLLGHM